MVNSFYNCGQQVLYIAARVGWNNCSANLPAFSNFKTNYDEAFISSRMAEILAAERLPDKAQRTEDSRTARIELLNQASECLHYWRRLKRYITKAYPANLLAIKLSAAGQSHYRKAANDNWLSAQRLILDGNAFVIDHKEELITYGHMPQSFILGFATAKAAFDQLHQQFIGASQNNGLSTQTKINTNNEVYNQLMNMLLDGQEIFKGQEALRKSFTLQQLLLIISGPGGQGIKGTITQPNRQPVTEGEIIFTGNTNKTVRIESNGHFECAQLSAGTNYTIIIKAPGFEDKIITNVEVATGVMKTVDTELVSGNANHK